METIFICIIFGAFILLSYTLGLRNGQKIVNNEKITIPSVSSIKKHMEITKHNKETEEYEKILQNIENYNGSEEGQIEVK